MSDTYRCTSCGGIFNGLGISESLWSSQRYCPGCALVKKQEDQHRESAYNQKNFGWNNISESEHVRRVKQLDDEIDDYFYRKYGPNWRDIPYK